MTDIPLIKIPWQTINMSERIKKAKDLINNSENFDDAKLKSVCVQMESLFIFQLFKQMRATVPKSGFLGGGKSEEIYRFMLDSKVADNLAKQGGIGIKTILYDQLKSVYDKQNSDK